jgi:formylglycine-generating enzyme required for sulfatase activity
VNCFGYNNMKLGLLFVISLTVLAATARTEANSPRGLSVSPPPGRPLPQRDLVLAQKQTSLEPGEIFRDCDDCPELVVVPPGDFVMGSAEIERAGSLRGTCQRF